MVEPDSKVFSQVGLWEAPIIDTSDPLRHGYGADALAFRFNRNGVLIAPPAYIVQALPYDFYTRRIGALPVGRATVKDVEALFGVSHTRANRPDGFMWYYAIQVYNPFEPRGGPRCGAHPQPSTRISLESHPTSGPFTCDPFCPS